MILTTLKSEGNAAVTADVSASASRSARPATAADPPVLKYGSIAPNFTVRDHNGKPVKLSDYAGRVVVIDFWATWCEPCLLSMPDINELARKFKGKNVVFLAVDGGDADDDYRAWYPKHKSYDALVFVRDPAERAKSVAKTLYKVSGIPAQFVVSKTGKVTFSSVGYGGPMVNLENAITKAANK